MQIIILMLAGLLAGIVSGMGIGGGTILIPILTIFVHLDQHSAQAVNLIYFIPTSIIAIIIHIKNKKVQKNILLYMIISGIIGSALGSMIALNIEGNLLRRIFGTFLIAMSIIEFFKIAKSK